MNGSQGTPESNFPTYTAQHTQTLSSVHIPSNPTFDSHTKIYLLVYIQISYKFVSHLHFRKRQIRQLIDERTIFGFVYIEMCLSVYLMRCGTDTLYIYFFHIERLTGSLVDL